jgi:hypothetical protein
VAKHSDEAEDKKLVKRMVKPNALKMRGGGVSNADRAKYGRNMAKVMNQRGSARGR